jgi:hypothetical protein
MVKPALVSVAVLALCAYAPPTEKPTSTVVSGAATPPDSSTKEKEHEADTAHPPDLSEQKLVFDPRAPGGARPMEEGKEEIAPVNPSAVTIFPAPPATTSTKKED